MDGVRKREMASPFNLLAMEWMIILKDQCKKGKSPSSRVVDFIPMLVLYGDNICNVQRSMHLIPSVRGLGNLHTAREPRESSKLAGKKKTRVQREREKEHERERKLLDYYSYPLQVGYSFYNVRTHA